MTSTPDYQPPSQAWQPPHQQPTYYPQQPPYPQEPPPPQQSTSPQAPLHREPGRMRLVLEVSSRTFVGLAALAAAVAACVAPFLRFWMQQFSATQPGPRNVRLVISGFGHSTYHPVSAASGQTHGHDTNYGVPLIIAAVVLAVAGIMLVAHKGNAVVSLLIAVIGGSMLVAIAVEGAMDRGARSSFDDKYSRWSVGYGWWLMILAAGLGAIMAGMATALVVRFNRVPSSVEDQHVGNTIGSVAP